MKEQTGCQPVVLLRQMPTLFCQANTKLEPVLRGQSVPQFREK